MRSPLAHQTWHRAGRKRPERRLSPLQRGPHSCHHHRETENARKTAGATHLPDRPLTTHRTISHSQPDAPPSGPAQLATLSPYLGLGAVACAGIDSRAKGGDNASHKPVSSEQATKVMKPTLRAAFWVVVLLLLMTARLPLLAAADSTPYPEPPAPTQEASEPYPGMATATPEETPTLQPTAEPQPTPTDSAPSPTAMLEDEAEPTAATTSAAASAEPTAVPPTASEPEVGASPYPATATPTQPPQTPFSPDARATDYPDGAQSVAPEAAVAGTATPDRAAALISTAVAASRASSSSSTSSRRAVCRAYVAFLGVAGLLLLVMHRRRLAKRRRQGKNQ